jgi:hypothetical protein
MGCSGKWTIVPMAISARPAAPVNSAKPKAGSGQVVIKVDGAGLNIPTLSAKRRSTQFDQTGRSNGSFGD